jgi:looped-hinge helix DNA binding domain, AbrB family
MVKATVSSKGQIAIPKVVRDELNLKPGTQLSIDVQGRSIVMRPLVADYPDWRTMEGMVPPGPSLSKGIEEDRAWELEHDEWIGKTRPSS